MPQNIDLITGHAPHIQAAPLFPPDNGALLSSCRTWRYKLWRRWSEAPPVVFIGLNPSTADESSDDHTIRRCMNMAGKWDVGGIIMLNLYGFRATHPKDLWTAPDPVGPDTDTCLLASCEEAAGVVACWGGFPEAGARIKQVVGMLEREGVPLSILGTTKSGHPRHPSRTPRGIQAMSTSWMTLLPKDPS